MNRKAICFVAMWIGTGESVGWAGTIDSALQDVINQAGPNDLIPVEFTMISQLNLASINTGGLNRAEMRRVMIKALKEHAALTQVPIVTAMNSPLPGQVIQQVQSTWLVNAVSTKANPSAVLALAGRSDVALATHLGRAEVPQPPNCIPPINPCPECSSSPYYRCDKCCNGVTINCAQGDTTCAFNSSCRDHPIGGYNLPCDPPCWHCVGTYSPAQPCEGYPSYPPIVSWVITWIDADDVWSQGYRGDGVAVGFIDNGFDYWHPDLLPNHMRNYADPPGDAFPDTCGSDDDCNGKIDDYRGWDFTTESSPPEDNDPFEERQGTFTPCAAPQFPKGGTAAHGTATLSVAVGAGKGNGTSQQWTGVAPNAWFVPIKSGFPNYDRTIPCCLGASYSDPSNTANAMAYALDRNLDLVLPEVQEAGMANFRIKADNLFAMGMLAVAPAGNFAPGVASPGLVPPPWIHPRQRQLEPSGRPSGVITVGSLEHCSDDRRSRSGHGPVFWNSVNVGQEYPQYWDYSTNGLIKPDIMAPGENNLAAASSNSCFRLQLSNQPGWPADAIYTVTGATSGATPVVAGVALLMLCKDNELTPTEIDSLLETTANEYSPTNKDALIGSGTINALEAINATEFFNHFDGMFSGGIEGGGPVVVKRSAESTHWIPHAEAGTPPEQWRFVDVDDEPRVCNGVLEGEAPLSKRSVTTVYHDRQSYRMDFDFVIKSFPTGGGHLTPISGAAVRFDRATGHGLFIITRKPQGNPTHVIILRKQSGDPQSGIVLAQENLAWDWTIGTPYRWNIWDDGSTITLTADRPGVSGELIFNHTPYSCVIAPTTKGLLVEDGTRVQFDNVRIEGFPSVSAFFPNTVTSRYVLTPPNGQAQAVGACPANNDASKHPGGITDPSHAGDYWIEAYIKDGGSQPIQGYWDVKVDFAECTQTHTGMPTSRQVYADSPTDADGRTVFRNALAFGGSDSCGYAVKAGGQTLKSFPGLSPLTPGGGLRNFDINGDGLVAIQDLSIWQAAFMSNEPTFVCDFQFDGLCAIQDLSILQKHFTEHQGEGSRTSPRKKTVDQRVADRGAAAKQKVEEEEANARGEDGELYLSIMDRLPPGAPLPPVNPQNAVTSVGSVGPRGRDITVGLYAAGAELAGAHARFSWPEGWELVAPPDSIVSGQIFGSSDRYWDADRSYMTAFDCISEDPVAIGRFDLHITQGGALRFDEENALVRTIDCRGQVRDLAGTGPHGLQASKGAAEAIPQPVVQLVRSSPTVSAEGAEFTLILGKEVSVSATVYDVTGRVVRIVADQMQYPIGTHTLRWDGTTNRGGRAGSGVYLIKLAVGGVQKTEHVVLVR